MLEKKLGLSHRRVTSALKSVTATFSKYSAFTYLKIIRFFYKLITSLVYLLKGSEVNKCGVLGGV